MTKPLTIEKSVGGGYAAYSSDDGELFGQIDMDDKEFECAFEVDIISLAEMKQIVEFMEALK